MTEPPILSLDDRPGIEDFLRSRRWIEPDEELVDVHRAGEGNMNLVLRVVTDRRSAILKQSRPWVEKYPEVAAPVERVEIEARFYRRVAREPELATGMPELLAADTASFAILLEDLGDAADCTDLYGGVPLGATEAESLVRWNALLHRATESDPDPAFANRAMRALNHQHIFVLPLEDGLPVDLDALEDGLAEAAAALRADDDLQRRVGELGALYLADGRCLLHGDYYPGSWLRTAEGPRVIDPEFCFYGPPELDLAVSLAHFALAGLELSVAESWQRGWTVAARRDVDEELVAGFAGTEVMRRLIGLAQLPLGGHVDRCALLGRAHRTITSGRLEDLW